MTQNTWTAVDDYISDLFIPSDPVLDAALQDSTAAGLPAMNVAPNQGKLLMLLAMSHGAKTILEIGTLGGYSTIWLARALPPDGHLITLELNPAYAEIARNNIARTGLADKVEVRVGPANDSLAELAAQKADFDLIFIDADKPGNPEYLTWSLKLSHKGTLIIGDNVVREGAVVDAASTNASVQGIRRFNEMLAAEPRVTVTEIQTVGSKGYDGFALALVTGE